MFLLHQYLAYQTFEFLQLAIWYIIIRHLNFTMVGYPMFVMFMVKKKEKYVYLEF